MNHTIVNLTAAAQQVAQFSHPFMHDDNIPGPFGERAVFCFVLLLLLLLSLSLLLLFCFVFKYLHWKPLLSDWWNSLIWECTAPGDHNILQKRYINDTALPEQNYFLHFFISQNGFQMHKNGLKFDNRRSNAKLHTLPSTTHQRELNLNPSVRY